MNNPRVEYNGQIPTELKVNPQDTAVDLGETNKYMNDSNQSLQISSPTFKRISCVQSNAGYATSRQLDTFEQACRIYGWKLQARASAFEGRSKKHTFTGKMPRRKPTAYMDT